MVRIRQTSTAFSLVELLVVLALILLLLSILAPLLSWGLHQAELTKCQAQLKAVVRGLTDYAFDHQRRYPDRPALYNQSPEGTPLIAYKADVLPTQLTLPHHITQFARPEGYDDRPKLRPYIMLSLLNCPLTDRIDLSRESHSLWVHAGYNMWWSWTWQTLASGGGMARMGSPLRWTDERGEHHSSVLIADSTSFDAEHDTFTASHPDDRAALTLLTNDDVPLGLGPEAVDPDGRSTRSFWSGSSAAAGRMVMNYAFESGAVERYTDHTHRPDLHGGPPGARFTVVQGSTHGVAAVQTVLPTGR